MDKNNRERRVVVTGLAPVSAIGFGKDALWKSILEKKTGIQKEEYFVDGELWDSFLLHKIEKFEIEEFKLEKSIIEEIRDWKEGRDDKDLLYAIAAVKLALDDSKLEYDRENNNLGLFLTVEHPGFEAFCEGIIKEAIGYFKKHSTVKQRLLEKDIYQHIYSRFVNNGYDLQTFMYLYLLAKAFGIHGYSLFTSNACASGLFSLDSAYKQIKCGGSEAAIVVGGDYPCTMFKHRWFKERNLYAEDGKIKPFSKKADGIVFGDGFSALVLEELEHAQKRGAQIYAEYMGGGFSLEGWKVVYPQAGNDSYQKAIKEALEKSQIPAEEIELISTHGVGIKITDAYEAQAITGTFANPKANPYICAFKPYVGHNLGGSALIETIILLLTLQNNYIPAVLNCEDYETKYNLNLARSPIKCSLNTVMKLSCGFAGYNAAAVFKKTR